MRKDILHLVSLNIRRELEEIGDEGLNEIRLRTDKPMILTINNEEFFLNNRKIEKRQNEKSYIVKEADIKETMEYITNYSLYAFNDELKKGFITVSGGHRVGICGKAIYENECIRTIRNIQSLNIRVSSQIIGCGEDTAHFLQERGRFKNTLIISRPGIGKTTLLRDLIRILSNGTGGLLGHTVGVVDERSEIASCYLGKPQNDIGIRTDVMDCCQKKDGMLMLVRSMKPDVIAVDEIGSSEDCRAIEYSALCGCNILATIHGTSIEEVLMKEGMRRLMEEKIFERYVVCNMDCNGTRQRKIYDGNYKLTGECYG